LRDLGFHKIAEKEAIVLLEKSDTDGFYEFSIKAVKNILAFQSSKPKNIRTKLPKINGKEMSIIERVEFYQRRLQIHEKIQLLNILYNKATYILRENPETEIEELDLPEIPDLDVELVNGKTQVIYFQIKIFSFLIHSQYKELIKLLKELKSQFDKKVFTYQYELVFYTFLLYSYAVFVLSTQEKSSLHNFVREYGNIVKDKGKYIDNISSRISNGISMIHKSLLVETSIYKKNLNSNDIKKLKFENDSFFLGSKTTYYKSLLHITYLYLIVKDYNSFNKCILEVNKANEVHTKIVGWELHYLELIESFENGTEKYTKYLINKFMRKKKVTSLHRFIVNLIQTLLKEPVDQHQSIMKVALPELERLEKNFLLHEILYSFWLKRRLSEVAA